MKSIYNFFKSVKLAVFLILLISGLSLIATFVPQAQDPAFYTRNYPEFISWIIQAVGFDNFFSSILFLLPCILFFINLSLCAAQRVIIEFQNKRKKQFGPDLIHTGILLLLIGCLITVLYRSEQFTYLDEGGGVTILDKYLLTVNKIDFFKYPGGRPKDWITTVNITVNNKTTVKDFQIEVNKPLTIGEITIYQTDYKDEYLLIIEDREANRFAWNPGEAVTDGEQTILFHRIEADQDIEGKLSAVFEVTHNNRTTEFVYCSTLDEIGGYTITNLSINKKTGLKFISDPGIAWVTIAGIILVAGIMLTFIQKLGEKEK